MGQKRQKMRSVQVRPAARTDGDPPPESPSKKRKSSMLFRSEQKPSAASYFLFAAHVLTTLLCLGWVLWLILLTIAPNETINVVMQTEMLDNGSFWLLIETPTTLLWLSVSCLTVVALGYLFVIMSFLMPSRRSNQVTTFTQEDKASRIRSAYDSLWLRVEEAAKTRTGSLLTLSFTGLKALNDKKSKARKTMNLGMKTIELLLHAILLYQMLENGLPKSLVGLFTAVIVLNGLTCAWLICFPSDRTAIAGISFSTVVDIFVAVLFPIIVLAWSLSTFQVDKKRLLINREVFLPGAFEQHSRMMADPVQTSIIAKSLASVRIVSVLGFFSRVGTQIALCFQMHATGLFIKDPAVRQQHGLFPKSRVAALVFVVYSALAVVYVEESVRTSRIACSPYSECVVHANRWITVKEGDLTQCPCLAIVDTNFAPKTFAEWRQPKNVTDMIRHLATSESLETLLLINRGLPVIPEELRRCKNLNHLCVSIRYGA